MSPEKKTNKKKVKKVYDTLLLEKEIWKGIGNENPSRTYAQ
jgi:hypothetical protein